MKAMVCEIVDFEKNVRLCDQTNWNGG